MIHSNISKPVSVDTYSTYQPSYPSYPINPEPDPSQMQYSIPIQPVPVYQQEAPVPVTVVPASQPVTVVPAPQPVTAPLLESQIPYAQPIPMAVPVQPVSVSVDGTHSAVLLTKSTVVRCPNCHTTVTTKISTPVWIIFFPILFFAFMAAVTLIAIFGNPILIAVIFPIGFIALSLVIILCMRKTKVTHTCPACLYTIGKTGTVIRW
ncbi:hypothetical protein WA588_005602 [Blastocystis sp. NMH]